MAATLREILPEKQRGCFVRIVLVTDQYHPMVGGVPAMTQRLAADLAELGHQVWLVAPSESLHTREESAGQVRLHRFASVAWTFYPGQRLALAPVMGLYRLFKRVRPDVVHLHSPLVLGTLAQVVAHRLHIPVVATNHFMPINVSRTLADEGLIGRGFSRLVYGYLVSLYNRCDYVSAPTSTALNLLVKYGLRVPGEAVSNGIDLRRFSPGAREEGLRQALGLPAENRPLALSVGRLMREKRLQVLLEAIAQVREPVHLAIAGTGPEAKSLQALAVRLGISRRVTFLGFVPDEWLAPLYRLADCFAIPSVAELQSLATLEAMACGLPVIAADAGALPELVHPGQNGYLFPPDMSDQLALCLEQWLRQPERWQAMGQASLKLVIQHNSQHVVQQWEAIYQRLARDVTEKKGDNDTTQEIEPVYAPASGSEP